MINEMAVADTTGDTKTVWDTENVEEVEAARATFNTLRAKNYIAYTVKLGGRKGEIITKFDPSLGGIIMVPPVVGG